MDPSSPKDITELTIYIMEVLKDQSAESISKSIGWK